MTSSMDRTTVIVMLLWLILLAGIAAESGDLAARPCRDDVECRSLDVQLKCRNLHNVTKKVCQCADDWQWSSDQQKCVPKNKWGFTEKVVLILVPVASGCCLVMCIAWACCVWIHKAHDAVKQDLEQKMQDKYDKYAETFYPDLVGDGLQPQQQQPQQPQQQPRPVEDPTAGYNQIDILPEKPEADYKEMTDMDLAYKATIRMLLTQPALSPKTSLWPYSGHSDHLMMRPNSAVTTSFLEPRGNVFFPSRSANNSARKRSPIMTGPYISDSVTLRTLHQHLRQQQTSSASGAENAAFSGDDSIMEKPDIRLDAVKRRKSSVVSGIEEISLVQMAVERFKAKRQLKNLPGASRFESIVDKVMKNRLEAAGSAAASTSSASSMATRTAQGRSSSLSESQGSSLSRSSLSSPESMVQKILRERQKKKITVKLTEGARNSSRRNVGRTEYIRSKKPLHLALKESASSRRMSKSDHQARIRQRVHLNEAKKFRLPPMPKEYYDSMIRLQNRAFLAHEDSPDVMTQSSFRTKSILKKKSSELCDTDGKSSSSGPVKNVTIQIEAEVY